jgi:sulfite reductase alpha subunit-like flavoprotein
MTKWFLLDSEGGKYKRLAQYITSNLGFGCQYLKDISLQILSKFSRIVFVVPTHGEGDPPTSCDSLWNSLMFVSDKKFLSGKKCAVFG